jgi:hypothetical protein
MDNYETYEEEKAWITPVGEYNIIHYDCPSKKEIEQRVTDLINDIVNGEGFEDDCPLCQAMSGEPYDIVYYCTVFCHECNKAKICKNFNPNLRNERS